MEFLWEVRSLRLLTLNKTQSHFSEQTSPYNSIRTRSKTKHIMILPFLELYVCLTSTWPISSVELACQSHANKPPIFSLPDQTYDTKGTHRRRHCLCHFSIAHVWELERVHSWPHDPVILPLPNAEINKNLILCGSRDGSSNQKHVYCSCRGSELSSYHSNWVKQNHL